MAEEINQQHLLKFAKKNEKYLLNTLTSQVEELTINLQELLSDSSRLVEKM